MSAWCHSRFANFARCAYIPIHVHTHEQPTLGPRTYNVKGYSHECTKIQTSDVANQCSTAVGDVSCHVLCIYCTTPCACCKNRAIVTSRMLLNTSIRSGLLSSAVFACMPRRVFCTRCSSIARFQLWTRRHTRENEALLNGGNALLLLHSFFDALHSVGGLNVYFNFPACERLHLDGHASPHPHHSAKRGTCTCYANRSGRR